MPLEKDAVINKFREVVQNLEVSRGRKVERYKGSHASERVEICIKPASGTVESVEVWSPTTATKAAERVLADIFWQFVPTGPVTGENHFQTAKDTFQRTGRYIKKFGDLGVAMEVRSGNYQLKAQQWTRLARMAVYRALKQATDHLNPGEEFRINPLDISTLSGLNVTDLVNEGYGESTAEEAVYGFTNGDPTPFFKTVGVKQIIDREAPRLLDL